MSQEAGTTEGGTVQVERTFSQAEVNGIVAEERRKMQAKLEASEAKVSELTSAAEAHGATVKQLETQVSEATGSGLRYKVALEHGLPIALAERLRGEDADSLAADAASLKDLVKPAEAPEAPPALGGGPQGDTTPAKPDMNALIRRSAGREG